MAKSASNRVLVTPSAYAKSHYLYVQEAGTLTSLEPHISRREKLDSLLFFLVLKGSGTVTLQNRIFPVHTGDCVWIDCHHTYSHESSSVYPWSLMWVHFYGAQALPYYQLYREKGGPVIFTPASVSPYMNALQQLFTLQSAKDSLCDLLSHKYLTDLITETFAEGFRADTPVAVPSKFVDIKNYLEAHYTEKLSLDKLAGHFFISKFHLVREYQRLYNTTIMNDLTLIRLSHAKEALRFGQESVEQIALSCGFQSSAYFIKVFKKYENMTPFQYRRKW